MKEEYQKGKVLEIFSKRGERSLRVIIQDNELGEFRINPNGKGILKELKPGDEIRYKADRFYTITEFYILGYKN